jgi:hypothetical protein
MSWLDSVSIVGRNINYCNKNGLFTRHSEAQTLPSRWARTASVPVGT